MCKLTSKSWKHEKMSKYTASILMYCMKRGICPTHPFVPLVVMKAKSIIAINCHHLGFVEPWLSRAKHPQKSHDRRGFLWRVRLQNLCPHQDTACLHSLVFIRFLSRPEPSEVHSTSNVCSPDFPCFVGTC